MSRRATSPRPCDVDWSAQHCGVRGGSVRDVERLMPDIMPIINGLGTVGVHVGGLVFDIKVHMLMPGQYPCIPNWHCDFVPRIDGVPRPELSTPDEKMWLWISGSPLPEFEGFEFPAQTWVEFDQTDRHRGTAATEHGWRGFVRATPKSVFPGHVADPLRRHAQVYLDAESFTW